MNAYDLMDLEDTTAWKANVTLAITALNERVAQLERDLRHRNEAFCGYLEREDGRRGD